MAGAGLATPRRGTGTRPLRACLRRAAAARYIEFLKVGDSIYPLEAWRQAGVDMMSPEPIERAYATLAEMIDQMEAIIVEKEIP